MYFYTSEVNLDGATFVAGNTAEFSGGDKGQ